MNAHTPLRLSAEARTKVRKAITAHPRWSQTRKELGLAIESMSSESLVTVAALLNIDLAPFVAPSTESAPNAQEAPDMNAHHKPRPHDAATVDALMARFMAIPAEEIKAGDAVFVADVFKTIKEKQDGAATDSQFYSIERVVDRYAPKAKEEKPKREKEITQEPKQAQAFAPESARKEITPETRAKLAFGERALKHPAPPAGDDAAQLAALIAKLAGQNAAPIDRDEVSRIAADAVTGAFPALLDLTRAAIKEAVDALPVTRIELAKPDGSTKEIEGHAHPKFATLLRAASARMANGYPPSIWLAGPAGSGKTHAGHQLADALDRPFHLNGALSMPHELLGFIDAGGNYHRTPFREAYEHGGVYMFDEVDGSDNSALLALNAALANGSATFPDAKIKRHPDCIILASANTWGLGATAEYVGRAKIDAAFLSRFPVRIAWDYDNALEIAISGHEKFARRVISARERARAAGLKVLIDPRASQAGAALIAAGMSEDDAASLTYLANVSADQRRMIEGA